MIPAGPHPLMMCGDADPLDEYFKVGHSVRFNAADAPSLTRTPGVAGNSKTFTLNFDLKRTVLDTNQTLFHANGSTSAFKIYFNGADNLLWVDANNGSLTFAAKSLSLFRDLSGHANVTVAIDTTAATKEAGVRIEVDGRDVTSFSSSNWTQNADTWWNRSGVVHSIGRGMWTTGNVYSAEAIMSNIRQIDGQFLTSSAFRRVHPRTGQWRPIRYAGTYGTLGFWLDFEDGSAATSAALGKDRSGNNNDWTPTNISVAAGSGCDWLEDTSTKSACVLNPQANTLTLSNGNLTVSAASILVTGVQATQRITAARPIYFEFENTTLTNANISFGTGAVDTRLPPSATYTVGGSTPHLCGFYASNNQYIIRENGTNFQVVAGGLPAGDFIRIAILGTSMWVGKNDVWWDSAGGTTGDPETGANPTITLDSSIAYIPWAHVAQNTGHINFGQRAWTKICPAKFEALNTKKLPIKSAGPMKSTDAFVAVKDSGANIAATLAAARAGWTAYLDICKSFGSEGWRWIFSDDPGNYIDPSNAATAKAAVPAFGGANYVGYSLRIGAAFGTATGTFNHTNLTPSVITDGLSSTRKVVILHRESAGGGNFYVYHPDLAAGKLLYLNTTAAETTDASISTVTAGGFTAAAALPSGMYRWLSIEEKDGLTKFGKYTGVATFPFLNCNNRPAMALFKRMGSAGQWPIFDAARDTSNPTKSRFFANLSNAETDGLVGGEAVDFYSNGMRPITTGSDINVAANDYAYIEFAAFHFRYANAR